ncbi:MAG: hypothetical protein U5O39_18180 [Gammaproteobacteria bacterium]|nr:hypothetical protein [Gammaproteobacteria bacterium]
MRDLDPNIAGELKATLDHARNASGETTAHLPLVLSAIANQLTVLEHRLRP